MAEGGRVQGQRLRPDAERERARTAWLIAADLAEELAEVGFLKVYEMPGKVGRGSPEPVTMARRVALYMATTLADVSSRPLAEAANVHRSTITHHVQTVEDLREDKPAFNTLLEDLERRFLYRCASVVIASLGLDLKASEGLT